MTRKTHCKRGHELTEQNSRWRTVGKYRLRGCRACTRAAARLRYRGMTLKRVAPKRTPNPNWQMSEIERDRCIALYLAGTTLDRLAEIFDRERHTISRLVRRRGVQRGRMVLTYYENAVEWNC